MKEYDYKAIPYKERLTTLCGIALNQYNVIHIDIQQFVSKYPVIKDMVARLTKELLFDVKMEMPDVTLFDETDLVRTSKDIFSQKREKFIVACHAKRKKLTRKTKKTLLNTTFKSVFYCL